MTLGQRLRWHRLRQGLSQETLAEAIGASARSIRRWEQDLAIPHGISRERLSRLFALDPQELFANLPTEAAPQGAPPLWTVPFPRNPCFTGREMIIQTLRSLLDPQYPIALTQAPALSGLGGIGKTQVAIEYAHRYAQQYSALFWLAAETTESLMSSLQAIAEQAQLPERETTNQSQMGAVVRRWLETHQGWLLIADNVENPDLLQMVLPPRRQGALLLTTRRSALGALATPLELPFMNAEEGATLMLRRAYRIGMTLSGEPEHLSAGAALSELVKLLDGLPLALDQAGAYLEETGCSVQDYLIQYYGRRQHLLDRRGIHGGAHPASVAATLRLSVERVEQASPPATELLRVCAFLHPEAIPEELLTAGAPFLGPVLEPVLSNPYRFDQALAALRSSSLLTRSPQTRTVSLHRLVQAVLQDWMEPAEVHQVQAGVVRMVNAAFPVWTPQNSGRCERSLTQALACIPLIEQSAGSLPEAGELVYKTGCYLLARGRYAEAEAPLALAVSLGEQQRTLDPILLIDRLEKLCELFLRQGKYTAAERLLDRSLAFEKEHLVSLHPRIGETLNNRAILSWYQGKYEQAEPLYQQALSIQEQHLGPEHQEVGITLDNLALLYFEQARYEQAEALFQRSLSIHEQQVGPEHPTTVGTLNNLTLLYVHMGRYEQALQAGLRALHIHEQYQNPNDPWKAVLLNNLAELYRLQKQYEQAEQMVLEAVRLQEQGLPPDHPEVPIVLSRLATIYRCQGKHEQAEPLFLRALRLREQHVGHEHPKVAHVLTELATLYREQGKYEQAEPLYLRAIAINEQHLAPEHPQTAASLHHLAHLYTQHGQEERAEPLFRRALAIRELRLGPEHPETIGLREELALLLERSRRQ
jgi:tetratricopeptide (TPR) repeat protein/DNA-binding XRE family transcriptional regulator